MSQAFRVAVDRILPQVLTAAVNQRRLPQNVAQNVLQSINNWFPQFMQICPQGALTEQQLAQLLDQFIAQNSGQQQQVVINTPNQQNFGNPQYGYMGNNQQNISPFASPSGYTSGPTKAPLFAQTAPPQNSGSAFTPIAPAADLEVVKTEAPAKDMSKYSPRWLTDNSDVVTTNNNITEGTKITRKVYPADNRSDVFVRYDVTTGSLLSSNNDIFGYVSMLTAGDGNYIVGINHKAATVVNVATEDMVEHITKLSELVEGVDSHGVKLQKVIKYLKKQSCTVFNAFEKIIISKFNEALKARCMHDSNTINLKVMVTKLDTILGFLPEQASPAIAKLVANPQYTPTLNSVLDTIFTQIRAMEVSCNEMDIRNAITTVKGMDGVRMLAEFDTNIHEFVKKFTTESTVVIVPKTVVFTNMDLNESATTVETMDTEDAVIVGVKTCSFDNIIGSFLTRVGPIRVVLSQGFSMIVGRTVDQEMVYAG